MSACTLWTHHRQQKALSSIEWLMARVGDGGPALNWHWVDVFSGLCVVDQLYWLLIRVHSAIQQTWGIHTMLFQCWPTVFDAGPGGPTMKQHRVNDPCLLGISFNLLAAEGETSPVFVYKNDKFYFALPHQPPWPHRHLVAFAWWQHTAVRFPMLHSTK